jgi:hypothetical protein
VTPRPETELPPPDDRLRAALRHAPDAMLQPPPALNARVLGDARRALAPPRWPQRWSAWLMRPATAGTLASLLLVGFIGLMWRDGAPPDSRGRAAPNPPDAPIASVPPVEAAAQAEKIERSHAAETLSKLQTTPGAARPTAPAAEALRSAPAAVARSGSPPDPRGEERRRVETAAPRAPAAVAPEPAPSPAQDRMSADAQRPALSAETQSAPAREAGEREQFAMQGLQPKSPAPTVDDPLAAPLAAMRAAAIDEPTLAWWTELRAATQGRWRRAPDDAAPDAAIAAPATSGSVHFEASAVIWQAAPAAPRWRAEIDAMQLRGLRERQPR